MFIFPSIIVDMNGDDMLHVLKNVTDYQFSCYIVLQKLTSCMKCFFFHLKNNSSIFGYDFLRCGSCNRNYFCIILLSTSTYFHAQSALQKYIEVWKANGPKILPDKVLI